VKPIISAVKISEIVSLMRCEQDTADRDQLKCARGAKLVSKRTDWLGASLVADCLGIGTVSHASKSPAFRTEMKTGTDICNANGDSSGK